ncbi:hypothetical protein ACTFIW_009762 [Dictyostelium discoideum]
MASISLSQSSSSNKLLKKEKSTENSLKPTTTTTTSPTSSKLGFLNRSKSNSNININELKNKFLEQQQQQQQQQQQEGSISNIAGVATTTQQNPSIVINSSSSSSSSSSHHPHHPHHQKTPSNSSSNFNLIKASFNQIGVAFNNNISPRSNRKEKEKDKDKDHQDNSNINNINNNNNNMPNNPTSSSSPSINNNLKGKNVASIIAANGANLNNSLSNLHQHVNNNSNNNLTNSFNSVSHNNITISSGGSALSYNYTQQLNQSGGGGSNNGSTSNSTSNSANNSLLSLASSINGNIGIDDSNGSNVMYGGGGGGDIASSYHSMSIDPLKSSTNTETIEVMVVGDELSNKARFISSFLNNGIGEDPTLEISTKKSIAIQSGAYNVNINTTVGQEEFWGINDVYYRSSQGFIFVYNVNSRESFLSFLKFRDKIIHEKGTENILMAMVGLTSPLINQESGEESCIREVTQQEAKRMADLYSCSFVELNSFGLDCEHQIQSIVTDLLGRITSGLSSTNNNNNNNNNSGNNNNNNNSANSNGNSNNNSNNNSTNNLNNSAILNESIAQSIEVLMLGDIFVGKTQIIQRLLGNTFQNAYKETTEWNRNVYQMTVNDVRYLLKIVDTCGLDIEETLNRERLVSTQGFIFVYSIASRESFLMIEQLRKKLSSIKSETKIPSVLIANKGDSLIRQVTFDEGSKMAQHLGSHYFEVSSMFSDDESIGRPFEQLLIDVQKSGNASGFEPSEIKKKGYLFKEGKKLKSMSKYFFKASRGNLSYCKNESNKSKVKSIQLSEQIQLAIPHNVHEKKDVWPFSIILDPVSKHSINLIASTEEERNAWIKAIKFNCFLEDITSNIIDDVVKSMVSEIASGVAGSGNNNNNNNNNNSHLKRSDTTQQLNNSGSFISGINANKPVPSFSNLSMSGGGSNNNSNNSTPMSSPYGSSNNFSSHLSQSTSSMSMSPQQQLQSVLLSSSNLSSSMNSSFSYSSSISSSYTDSMSGSPPDSNGQVFPQSPQLKKTLFQRTTSFSKGSKLK